MIEGVWDNYDSSTGTIQRSLCSVVGLLTDGVRALPLDHKLWISKELMLDQYKTKLKLAQELITEIKNHFTVHMVLMDGLYATKEMIKYLIEQDMRFEMRFHSNRKIELEGRSVLVPIKDYFHDQLKPRMNSRTIKGLWGGMNLFFTAVRRICKNGKETIIYQVSNYQARSSQHVKVYSKRWKIEKFFRTAKQDLGLNDCQARGLSAQYNHIKEVFYAYGLAQYIQHKYALNNVESAIDLIRHKWRSNSTASLNDLDQIFRIH